MKACQPGEILTVLNHVLFLKALVVFLLFTPKVEASNFLCSDLLKAQRTQYEKSLTWDFNFRDSLPQTEIPKSKWQSCCGRYGPLPSKYPKAVAPKKYDSTTWLRDKTVATAKKYLGLPYKHRHIPGMGGLDCSNFSAWVYNYGLGLSFTSNIRKQAHHVGRRLAPSEKIKKGDLIFIWSEDQTWLSHVAVYIGDGKIIDSTGPGVAIRDYKGWYKERFAWARRIIE